MPPNLKFEIDDATKEWTWADNTFDFVHLRYLVGAVENWESLMREAYRCCKPGGWVESCEVDGDIVSDDGTAETELGFQTWTRLFREGGAKIGRSFNTIADDLQRPAIEAAGFKDIHVVNYKIPIGGWPRDKTLAEIGRCALLALTNDMQGRCPVKTTGTPPAHPAPTSARAVTDTRAWRTNRIRLHSVHMGQDSGSGQQRISDLPDDLPQSFGEQDCPSVLQSALCLRAKARGKGT